MISSEKRQALSLILTNYANDEDVTTTEAITGVIGLLGLNDEKTLRDEFAMAAMPLVWSSSASSAENAMSAYMVAWEMMRARK